MINGIGKMIKPDGYIYDGSWLNGYRQGKGTINYVSGEEY